MKNWWWIVFKRQIITPSIVLMLLAIPLFAVLMRSVNTREEGVVRILLLSEESGESTASGICDRLKDLSNPVIRFETCTDEDELRESVMNGTSQGGYIFPRDFDMKLMTGSKRDLITVVRSDAEENARVIDEIVFAQLYDVLGELTANRYADGQFGSADAERASFIHEKYDEYKNAEKPFRFELPDGSIHPMLEGDMGELKEKTTGKPIAGLIGIMISLISLSAGLLWYRDRDRRVFMWLSPVKRVLVHVIYVLVPTYIAGVFGTLSIYILGINEDWWTEVIRMHLYIFMLVFASYLIQVVIRSQRIYIGCIPVCVFISLLGGGVFSELDEIAFISWIKPIVPLSTYMNL